MKEIIIKEYPTYDLLGIVKDEDYEKYIKTKDTSLIMYKTCTETKKPTTIENFYIKRRRDAKYEKRFLG